MMRPGLPPRQWALPALLGLLLAILPAACAPAGPGAAPVDFEQLVTEPARFDGRLVCTQGVYVSGFEASALGASTTQRGGLRYLTEPAIWIERGDFTARGACLRDGAASQQFEFCHVTACGRFDRCEGCGHGGGFRFQLVGQ